MKHLFIELEVREGERVHTHRILHTTLAENIYFAAERYVASFWGWGEREDNHWWFFGEITATLKKVMEITEYEYKLMGRIFSGDKIPGYFQIQHAGWCEASQREEIQVHCGEHGNLFLFQDDGKLGFIVDVYGENDHVGTMQVWEEDLCPDEDDAPENFSDLEIEEFKKNWGQTHNEVCAELGYSRKGSDELLMEDYFWSHADEKWYNKEASMFTEREQAIANYLRANL